VCWPGFEVLILRLNHLNFTVSKKLPLPIFRSFSGAAFAGLLALTGASAFAQAPSTPLAVAELPAHPWVIPSPREAESYFTNLKDGGVYESPFVARMGLSMRGLVPAGKSAGRAGHHHLLINQALPLDFKKPLPFNDKYIHFGKGQMEALVDLPPGPYELRLLLADQGHIPYFVYSKPVKITVSKQNKGVLPASVLGAPGVQILSPASGDAVSRPFRVQFHASGYNVSSAAPKAPDTGHFRLTMERAGHKPEVMNFSGGQTETWINPPPGDYKLQLELISNTDDSVSSKAKPVTIAVQGR
jgi:hypothetical protein